MNALLFRALATFARMNGFVLLHQSEAEEGAQAVGAAQSQIPASGPVAERLMSHLGTLRDLLRPQQKDGGPRHLEELDSPLPLRHAGDPPHRRQPAAPEWDTSDADELVRRMQALADSLRMIPDRAAVLEMLQVGPAADILRLGVCDVVVAESEYPTV
jgi:hypothetical protein